MVKGSPSKLALGVSLVLTGILLIGSGQEKKVSNSSDTFAQEPVKIEGFVSEEENESLVPKRILIPDIDIDLEVGRSKVIGGYWEVFSDKAGWGEGSGLAGREGNQVIFAHAREGLFLPLRSIKPGAKIYVLTDSSWFNYEVAEIKEVTPSQIEVITPTPDETLTLYTCSGFGDSMRLIVIAKRV